MADHNPHPLLLAFIFRYFATERGHKPFKMDEKVVVVVAKKKNRPNMFVKFYKSLTIEPVIFMHAIGLAIINGSQVSTESGNIAACIHVRATDWHAALLQETPNEHAVMPRAPMH